jgi:hypothetical protein
VEHGLWVDLSTSDVSGAFDSPERTAQYICWRRVGIPAPLATYLVSLAALSTYKISSPYGMRNPDLPGDDVIPELDNPFLPARGLTQGACPGMALNSSTSSFKTLPALSRIGRH